jgi:hypothetical protein
MDYEISKKFHECSSFAYDFTLQLSDADQQAAASAHVA